MVRFFRPNFLQSSRKVNVTILALTLLSGYLSGGLCGGRADSLLFQLMRMGALSHVSIVSVLPVLLLPLLLSAFAVYIGFRQCVLLIAFIKAFLFAYLYCSVLVFFPSSGLLFALLFLCTDFLIMPVLCWFWLRCINRDAAESVGTIPVMLLIMSIVFFDYQVISPFLASLLSR